MTNREFAHGSGPGAITPDGCAVEFYAQLTADDEPEIIQRVVPAGATVLELGAGAGRVTHPLRDRGYLVTAVDESPEMLARISGAETVCAAIETLELGRRFDAVLLMSNLIEVPDDALLRGFLRTCSAHVHPAGTVLLERHDPRWHDTVTDGEHVDTRGRHVRLRDITRPASGLLSMSIDYDVDGRSWTQSFVTRRLTDERLAAELAAVGLRVTGFPDSARRWVAAARTA